MEYKVTLSYRKISVIEQSVHFGFNRFLAIVNHRGFRYAVAENIRHALYVVKKLGIKSLRRLDFVEIQFVGHRLDKVYL